LPLLPNFIRLPGRVESIESLIASLRSIACRQIFELTRSIEMLLV